MGMWITSLFYEAFVECPFSTVLCLGICWIYVKVALQEYDSRYVSISYAECMGKKQYWRLLTTHLYHQSFIEVFFNCTLIWSCRIVEKIYGTFFFFRYTVLLGLSEYAIAFSIIHMLCKLRTLTPHMAVLADLLKGLNTIGMTGILLGWAAFISITSQNFSTVDEKPFPYFMIFGILPLNAVYAPLVVLILSYMILPRENMISSWAGITSGYFLVSGLLLILQENFWSVCFLFDLSLVAVVSFYNQHSALAYPSLQHTAAGGVEMTAMAGVPGQGAMGGSPGLAYGPISDHDFDDEDGDLEGLEAGDGVGGVQIMPMRSLSGLESDYSPVSPLPFQHLTNPSTSSGDGYQQMNNSSLMEENA